MKPSSESNLRQRIREHVPCVNGQPARVGIGTAYLGGPADAARLREIEQTLDTAYEWGFRIFDTSPRYGEAEERLGRWLRKVPRDSVLLWSKAAIPEHLQTDEARRHVCHQLQQSLERLGTDRLDAWFFHDIERLEQVFSPGGALETAREAVAAGRVAHVGVATRPHDVLHDAAHHEAISLILTHSDYNLTDVSAGPLIASVSKAGKAVVNASPLGWGLLANRYALDRMQAVFGMENRVRAARTVWELAAEKGISTLALALQFPGRNPDIDVTLTGPANQMEVRSTVEALGATIPPTAWRRLEAALRARAPNVTG